MSTRSPATPTPKRGARPIALPSYAHDNADRKRTLDCVVRLTISLTMQCYEKSNSTII